MDREQWGNWLELGGALVAWLAAGIPWVLQMFSRPELLAQPRHQIWLAGYVGFLALFYVADLCECRLGSRLLAVLTLGAESLVALLLIGLDLSGLAGVLLVAAVGRPGDLPLLEFALRQLWDTRTGKRRVLTLKAYDNIGRLAQAMVSIQAIKGVAIGEAWDVAGRPGSEAHDEIFWSEERGWFRETNRAGSGS